MTTIGRLFAFAGIGVTVLLAGCGTEAAQGFENDASAASEEAAPQVAAQATGTVIEVKMVTDGVGNYFEPAEVKAHPGDVVRFVLVSGVHNVSFPAGENASGAALPATSEYLQLPGQTHDLAVELAPGSYKFQCDPHAALGMVGTLIVE